MNLTEKSPHDPGKLTSGHRNGGSSINCGKDQSLSQDNLDNSWRKQRSY